MAMVFYMWITNCENTLKLFWNILSVICRFHAISHKNALSWIPQFGVQGLTMSYLILCYNKTLTVVVLKVKTQTWKLTLLRINLSLNSLLLNVSGCLFAFDDDGQLVVTDISLYLWQKSICCLRWDPTGVLLASCAGDGMARIWSYAEDRWILVYELPHAASVCLIEWCSVIGKADTYTLMLAR